MAPLPANNTDRYFIDYQQGQYAHTMIVRTDGTLTASEVGDILETFFGDIDTLLYATTVTGLRFQAEGTDFSFPVDDAFVGTTYGSGAVPDDAAPRFLNFVGRGLTGRRVKQYVFGYNGSLSAFRLTSSESGTIAAAVATLNDLNGAFLDISGAEPIYASYANIGYNDYWVHRVRG